MAKKKKKTLPSVLTFKDSKPMEMRYDDKESKYKLTVCRAGDPGLYDEVRINIWKGKKCVADIYVGGTNKDEPRVLITLGGDGDGDHELLVWPMRNGLQAVENNKYTRGFDGTS